MTCHRSELFLGRELYHTRSVFRPVKQDIMESRELLRNRKRSNKGREFIGMGLFVSLNYLQMPLMPSKKWNKHILMASKKWNKHIWISLDACFSFIFFLRDIYQDAGARDTDSVGPQAAASAKLHNCTCSMVVHKFN